MQGSAMPALALNAIFFYYQALTILRRVDHHGYFSNAVVGKSRTPHFFGFKDVSSIEDYGSPWGNPFQFSDGRLAPGQAGIKR
jgi:hypothetical protein